MGLSIRNGFGYSHPHKKDFNVELTVPHSDSTENSSNGDWERPSISALEADVAYFNARLALLSKVPESPYQEAQLRAYKRLEEVLQENLARLKGNKKKRHGA